MSLKSIEPLSALSTYQHKVALAMASAPLQAPSHSPASPRHDTLLEDAEELFAHLENSVQEKLECEALLLKDLMDLNAQLTNIKPNKSKQDLKAAHSSHQRKTGNTAPTPAPTHPKTCQASRGCLQN